MNSTAEGLGPGSLPNSPDFRDFTPDDESELAAPPIPQEQAPVPDMLKAVGVEAPAKTASLLNSVELRNACPPIEDQKREKEAG